MRKYFSALLLASGASQRFGRDKLLARVQGKTVFEHGFRRFLQAGFFDSIVVTYRDLEQKMKLEQITHRALKRTPAKLRQLKGRKKSKCQQHLKIQWIQGGKRRQDSVFLALTQLNIAEGLAGADEIIFIHDAARPLVRVSQLKQLKRLVQTQGSTILARRPSSTIKKSLPLPGGQGYLQDLERAYLWEAETPQVFPYSTILQAYTRVQNYDISITDDAAALQFLGENVHVLENFSPNFKITTPEDLKLLRVVLLG